jgi:L,D-peptidoglycan transpeptidase YkuD (ErfK/YbiS/YcfS/YnhG family)
MPATFRSLTATELNRFHWPHGAPFPFCRLWFLPAGLKFYFGTKMGKTNMRLSRLRIAVDRTKYKDSRNFLQKTEKTSALGRLGPKRGLSRLIVTRMPCSEQARNFPSGRFHAGGMVLSCALGRAGISRAKREGDRATPAGTFRLLGGLFRRDRVLRQAWALPIAEIKPSDGWCDDPASPSYNRQVALPCRASHEKLWRRDRLYDVVVVLGYNIHPRRKFRGSAIFLHCATPDFAPTEGCVALSVTDLRRLLPRVSRKAVLIVR